MIDKLIVKNADGISYNEEDITKIREFSDLIKKDIEGQKDNRLLKADPSI